MSNATRQHWNFGDQRRLARESGITPETLNAILRGRQMTSKVTAMAIEGAAEKLGLALSAEDIMFPERSFNPLIKACRLDLDAKQQG